MTKNEFMNILISDGIWISAICPHCSQLPEYKISFLLCIFIIFCERKIIEKIF